MSDELRNLMRGSAENISVPSDDVNNVVRGGQSLRWRRRLYAAGVGVLVATVVWAGVPALTSSQKDDGPRIAGTPKPDETKSGPPRGYEVSTGPYGGCQAVPFRPTWLPDGWSYKLEPGSGGQREIPLGEQTPRALGHYFGPEEDPIPGYIDVYVQGTYYALPPKGGEIVAVMGDKGRIGAVEDGYSLEIEYRGCEYSVMGFGPSKEELRRVGEGLRPAEDCDDGRVVGPDADLEDGRHFVYITAVDIVDHGMGIQFDTAEFLTGAEANEAAIAAGAIEEGGSVPNDYFIVNQSKRTAALGFADDVEVYIETTSQDGMPGLATADTLWLACAFEGENFVEESRDRGPWWITVKDGEVTKLEEQYLP